MAAALKRYFLVLSQAKTGTTTLGRVLPAALPAGSYLARFHDHRLRPVDPASMTPGKYAVRQRDLGVLEDIRGLDPAAARLVVVTAVRDPVARMYSHFFEKQVYPSEALRGTTAKEWTPERFVRRFEPAFRATLKPLLRGELGYLQDVLNDGLAREFPNLGFRGLAAGLERAGGHARYRSGAVIGLVLPSRSLLAALREALADLGIDPGGVTDTVAYAAEARGFAGLYRAFMDLMPFPDRALDLAYRSPMLRLLHAPDEIDAMRREWAARWGAGRP